jgi:hypothetical protein
MAGTGTYKFYKAAQNGKYKYHAIAQAGASQDINISSRPWLETPYAGTQRIHSGRSG